MPITPEDIASKTFTPVRLREGYEMGEVDQFLDEVEAELQRLIRENENLRKQVEAAGGEAPTSEDSSDSSADDAKQKKADEQAAADKAAEKKAAEKKAAEEKAAAEKQAADHKDESAPAAKAGDREPRVLEEIKVTTSSEASKAASRLLELATNNAEIVVEEAREEAEEILAEAKSEAEEITSNAEKRKNSLDEETEKRREELTAGLKKEQSELDAKVTNLREFEKAYRSNLKDYFSQQLQQIEQAEIEPKDAPADAGEAQTEPEANVTEVDVETKPNG